MFKSMPLKTIVVLLLVMVFFVPLAEARLIAGGPETVVTGSTLILTGKVTANQEAEEERTFTVKVDRLLKGSYQGEEIVLTERKNPVYGWVHIRHVPEVDKELLLFLRHEDDSTPYFAFDLNCIALVEGGEVTGLLGGSNVGINDEHWEIEDYLEEYNVFLNSAGLVETEIEAVNTTSVNEESFFAIDDEVSKNNSSIGIIGGADGPTSILVSGDPFKALIVPAIVLAAVFFIIGFAVGYIVKAKRIKQVK
jgi:hypothetical protein